MDIRRACERVWSLYNMEGIKMKPGVNMCTITGDIPDFTVIIIRSE